MFASQSGPGSDPFHKMLSKPLLSAQRGGGAGAAATNGSRFQEVNRWSSQQQQQAAGGVVNSGYDEGDNESVVVGRKEMPSSYAASVYSNMAQLPKYPPLDPAERLERLQEYHDVKHPSKTVDEVEMEKTQKINDNNLALENQIQMVEFSNGFMNVKRSAIVPQHCSNLHHNGFYGELSFSLPGGKPVDFKPPNPMTCFGSIFDWAQGGIDIPPASEPFGDLQNAYLVRFFFTHFRNTSPVAVGVVLGEMTQNQFVPLGRQTHYCDKAYSAYQTDKFHLILPPNSESQKESDLYRSTTHVNNSYGKDYPFLTSSRENILYRCEPLGKGAKNGWLVPLRHAILNWCVEEGDFPRDEMPIESKDHAKDGEVFYVVPKKTMEFVVQALIKKASLYIPVTDMRALTLRFYPLVNGPHSSDQCLRSILEREHEVEVKWGSSGMEAATKTEAAKRMNKKELKEKHGITFLAEFFIMYRRIAQDAIEGPSSSFPEEGGLADEDD